MQDLLNDELFMKAAKGPKEDLVEYRKQWLSKNPGQNEQFESALQLVLSISYKNPKQLPEAAYSEMWQKLINYKRFSDERRASGQSVLRKLYPSVLKIAAAVLLLITATFLVVHYSSYQSEEKILLSDGFIHVEVPSGAQQKQMVLPDGSSVWLNAGSQLVYPPQFSKEQRHVKLKGEGFFEVVEDKDRPFVVKAGDINARVLGTSFNVRYYNEMETIEVALVTGKVAVEDPLGNSMELLPSEMASFSTVSKTFQKSLFDVRNITGWKEGILVFEKATIEQIVRDLERWYGVTIRLDLEKSFTGKYTGRFDNETIEVVLEGVGYANGFSFNIDNKNVTIYNREDK